MNKYYFIYLFFFSQIIYSQAIYKTFPSKKLGTERELKIQLPRNYENSENKTYPLIIVLDGDYLFEPMAGNVDYYSYWDDIPESIVVGVNQLRTRDADSFYDETALPAKDGAKFFEFLGMELLKHLETNYRTSGFVAIAGHDLTANFLNYYLLKENPLFDAYINLSPDYAPGVPEWLIESLKTSSTPKWFFLATSTNDIKDLQTSIRQFHQGLNSIENENLHYFFEDFDGATHYSLVGRAIPLALESIFETYRPIGIKEYDQIVLESSPYDYLINKYETIQNNFGMDMPIRFNDFFAVGKALEANQNWDEMEKLGDLARKQYPTSALGIYYQARSYEETGRSKKAMKTYQSAYGQEEAGFVTVNFMLDKAEKIKQDFGY
ncbi:alpha/beta hydrolase [Salinimicrobium flavum]|uniref:Alpha/beta hydrolase n=1 Tax=Salinimicrobium flavum TaxID=1737065 RepID=A0ABW5IUP4_9FLAO